MAARPTAQLVVNATGLMTLGRNDAQTTQDQHLLVLGLPLNAQTGDFNFFCSRIQRLVGLYRLNEFFYVPA